MTKVEMIRDLAVQIRRDTIMAISCAGTGHPGGALGAAEIFAVLYREALNQSPENLNCPNRDRFVLSNGHICASYYACLARCGYFDPGLLKQFRKLGSPLQGHPSRIHLPSFIEASSGPLGQGLSVANGLALALRQEGRGSRVYCLVGDGEMQEGQIWEAILTAAQHRLSNVTLVISYNGLQIDGDIAEVKNIEPLEEKMNAFGWFVLDVDGHDPDALMSAFARVKESTDAPSAIIARTVMGRGVSFMENQAKWHGGSLSQDQVRDALSEIGLSRQYVDFTVEGVFA
ncbi:transketolase [Alkalispirochaeta sphaeroplastigenens]|uniref:Transketolase n=2 Tax=Alkalispirochaeta sphaeroplastigenens TaxID=1187066 RepID=A0A2S4JI73_9SPIO|nr:transketolase [Alkalispirochaeta sphaeroplastigenens]